MSVITSIVNKQSASIDKLILPYGLNLSTAPNITADLGKLAYNLTDNKIYSGDGTNWVDVSGGATQVVGPASATDNALARFDGTTGKIVQNSVVIVGDTGAVTGLASLNGAAVPTGTNTGDVTMSVVGSTANANGASLSGQALTLQPASISYPGVVSTVAQTFSGIKTFADGIDFDDAAPSNPIVNLTFNNMCQANFTGASSVTYGGCITVGSFNLVATNFQSITSLAIGQYLPGAGTHAAGLITIIFPAAVNALHPGALPTEFAPGIVRNGLVQVLDNGVVKTGNFHVDGFGFITVGVGIDASGNLLPFTVDGDNGLFDQICWYF